MQRRYFFGLFYPILLLSLFLNYGCGTTSAVVQKIKKKEPYLKKRVMVFPPIDHSGLPPGKAAQIASELINLIKESPGLLLFAPPSDISLPEEIKSPEYGVVYYHPDLAKMARDMNMNAVMAAYLPPIETTTGRAGIWPFRYDSKNYKISTIMNVMDATNGCLYLTDLVSEEVAFPKEETETRNAAENVDLALTEALPAILERQTSAIVDHLAKEPWTGRILDVSNGVLKINAGKDVGVLPEHRFIVFEQGESIVCGTGRSVQPLGKKKGQIKTVSVMEQYALAEPEAGGPFSPGETILFSPN